jgi:hypothetical protein
MIHKRGKAMNTKFDFKRVIVIASLVLMILGSTFSPTYAAQPININGKCNEWGGRAHIDDPEGDSSVATSDIKSFYFESIPNDDNVYFMMERWLGGEELVVYSLSIDTNNNGQYGDADDRLVVIQYQPTKNKSIVNIDVYDGLGGLQHSIGPENWGEGKNKGGTCVEWKISYTDLGIAPFQPIRMTLTSASEISLPPEDSTGEVQWTPASALGWPLLGAIMVAGVGLLWYQRKKLT